jgi:hypothetical protein
MRSVREGIAIALLACGCGRVAFEPTADARINGAVDGNVDGVAINCTSDDFSAGTGSTWVAFGNASFTTSFASGRLDISLTPSMNGYAGIDGKTAFDFTGASVTIEVPLVVGQPNTENYILVYVAMTSFYAISYDGGRLHTYRRVMGTDTAMTFPYDSTNDRHWRIAHDPAAGEIVFSTSADRMTWLERYRVPATIPVTALSVELAAGEYLGGTASPGAAAYDNFDLCVP